MRNNLLTNQSEQMINQMKEEIAQELGIELGANTSARDNGRVGGQVVSRLIEMGKQQMISDNMNNNQQFVNNKYQQHDQLH